MRILPFLLPILFLTNLAIGQILLTEQHEKYPLYTQLDSQTMAPYQNLFDFGKFNMDTCLAFREIIKPFADQNDPLALYLYGKSYDLFPFGLGDSTSALIALDYYNKSAEQNYVLAHFILYGTYRYSFMNVPKDPEKSVKALRNVLKYGNNSIKANGFRQMAGLFYGKDTSALHHPDFTNITYNIDSTIYYLNQSLELEPNDTWSLDYLGYLYTTQKLYDTASTYYLRSDNIQSKLKVAQWLIKGTFIEKDVDRGLEIIYQAIEALKDEKGYMGAVHPLFLINYLHHCEKIISKEQVGPHFQETFICP